MSRRLQATKSERELVKQICLASGFARDETTHMKYLFGSCSRPELLRRFPELGAFRDICCYWNMMMAPTRAALPELKQWRSHHAVLSWSVTDEGKFSVRGFGRVLEFFPEKEQESLLSQFKGLIGIAKPRVAPSAAQPSAFVDEVISTEDDVLYVKNLPDFGGRLSGHNAELLLQYLTAPYLRIPLLLSFFCDDMRLKALAVDELQDVLDACLFEPGPWLPDAPVPTPTMIPASREHLATPCGLLLNELVKSPEFTLTSIQRIVDCLLDFDEGRYSKSCAPYVLYGVRLLVRVEAHLNMMLDHRAWQKQLVHTRVSGTGGGSAVRGLQSHDPKLSKQHIRIIRTAANEIHWKLTGKVTKLLESWCTRCARQRMFTECCELWSHLAYTRANIQSMDRESARILLSAQVFLHCNQHDGDELSPEVLGDQPKEHIPRTELADVFQRHRCGVHLWLCEQPKEADGVLEAVLDVVSKQQQEFHYDKYETQAKQVDRHWIRGDGDFAGRYRPDTEFTDEELSSTSTYEGWLRFKTMESVGTEIDTMLGSLTLKREGLAVLPASITAMPDARLIFGGERPYGGIQAAPVQLSAQRRWLRLVGLRHDVQLWQPDARTISAEEMGFRRAFPSKLKDVEEWVADTWQSCIGNTLPPGSQCLWLRKEAVVGDMARLVGYLRAPSDDKDEPPLQLREVVVAKDPALVQIYDIVPYGRRWYPQLVWSSSDTLSMHDMPLMIQCDNRDERFFCGGSVAEPDTIAGVDPQLIVLRNLNAEIGEQTAIPARFLRGLLPDALLQAYEIWQSSKDGTLFGYERSPDADAPTLLQVKLQKIGGDDRAGFCTSAASAVIRRIPVIPTSGPPCMADYQASRPTHTLLNLQRAGLVADLAGVRQLFNRLENLSHILVWSELDINRSDRLSVDLIELPRLNLSFRRPARTARFLSVEYDGLCISNHRSEQVNAILAATGPAAILLESAAQELHVLMPVRLMNIGHGIGLCV